MNALGTVLVWISAAIVALPLSPCAFFSSACCGHKQAAQAEEVAHDAERPCCAQHEPPAKPADDGEHERPCSSVCCQVSPFVPAEQVVVDAHPWAMLAALSPLADAPIENVAAQPLVLRPPIPLQVLHCQWRC